MRNRSQQEPVLRLFRLRTAKLEATISRLSRDREGLDLIQDVTSILRDPRGGKPLAQAQEVADLLGRRQGFDHSAILKLSPQNFLLDPVALTSEGQGVEFVEKDKDYVRSRHPRRGFGITGWVAEHGIPARIADVRVDGRYVAMRSAIRSELCVPIHVDGCVAGVLNVETDRIDAYARADQLILETIALQLSGVMRALD